MRSTLETTTWLAIRISVGQINVGQFSVLFRTLTILLLWSTAPDAQTAQAGLILDVAGATPLIAPASYGASASLDDNTFVNRNLGLSNFQYFGSTLSTLTIGMNGNLSATQATQEPFFPGPFASTPVGLMIAPMWDDILFLNPQQFPQLTPVNQIYETVVQNGYYAVTWSNVRLYLDVTTDQLGNVISVPPESMSVQAVLFNATTTIRGFEFHANDIAFGYVSRTGNTGDFGAITAEIGLNSPSNANVLLPGARDSSGMIKSAQAATLIPWQANNFALFRANTDLNGAFTNYSASIENFTADIAAVPEPTTLLGASALAVTCLLRITRRKKSA